MDQPPPLSPPPVIPASSPAVESGDVTGGVIPYKNPQALVAYYLGWFSVIPILGFFSGIVALALGISGLKERKKRPVIRGTVHAWFGIILGALSIVAHVLIVVLIAVMAFKNSRP